MIELLLGVGILCGVHLFAYRLKFLQVVPRSGWLSLAGGASVAYVFLHLLPEIQEGHEELRETGNAWFTWTEYPAYVIALLGLVTFYTLERLARRHGPMAHHEDLEDHHERVRAIFWLQMVSFTVYNLIIGCLLLEVQEEDERSFWLYVIAMGFHFFVTDQGFQRHYRKPYLRIGRWILSGAVLVGWGLSLLREIPHVYLAPLISFIGGGVILNVLKEELPAEQDSKVGPFLIGIFGYGALVLLLE